MRPVDPEEIVPFRVTISEVEIQDIRRRLAATRFIPTPPESEWRSGVPVAYLRQLVDHWLNHFDRAVADAWTLDEGGYFGMLRTRPQTLGHGLNDSPAGLAAWIVEKWWAWTVPPGSGRTLDEFLSFDQLLSIVAIYWLTQTVNSANWAYYERGGRDREPGEQSGVPTGVARTTQPIELAPRHWAERFFTDIRHWRELGKGGHFVTMQEPRLLADSIREFLRPLRQDFRRGESFDAKDMAGGDGASEPMR
jgi:pimeloyl-ACP methyl ester carboxylesterase